MKSIKQHINEALKINSKSKVVKTDFKYFPKTKDELKEIIKQRIESEGNECDLNDIDVSEIIDMSFLFYRFSKFNGDISNWDVSNVKSMECMFSDSEFNKDISKWDVSKVTNMEYMFAGSKFNKDISKWDVSNVLDDFKIFYKCPIEEKYKAKFN